MYIEGVYYRFEYNKSFQNASFSLVNVKLEWRLPTTKAFAFSLEVENWNTVFYRILLKMGVFCRLRGLRQKSSELCKSFKMILVLTSLNWNKVEMRSFNPLHKNAQ